MSVYLSLPNVSQVDPSGHGPVSNWHVSARFSRATSITISKAGAFDKLSDAAMASWAFAELSQLKLLRTLSLENCTRLSAAGLSALALACPHLHTLKLPPVRLLVYEPLLAGRRGNASKPARFRGHGQTPHPNNCCKPPSIKP